MSHDYLIDQNMKPGPYLYCTIRDTWCGMEHSVKERIFEPYFTIKEEVRETGLGLSVVHGIVKSHGGHILVNSSPGEGSVFHVYIPVTTEDIIETKTVLNRQLNIQKKM